MKNYSISISLLFSTLICQAQSFAPSQMSEILYGVAYYYEYMPTERLEEDVRMMKEAGINVVRIAESTWSYQEPRNGEFNMDYHVRIMDVMHANGIKVIVGTPTYAFPAWLAIKYPSILLTDKTGQKKYGARQIMDIANPDFLKYAERIIRKLMETTADHPAVIGFQVDNETKHYDTEGPIVQAKFVEYLKNTFGNPEAMNKAFGLNYWSNSIYDWDDMPSTVGTINGSLRNEFEIFRRKLVTDYLAWQVGIVNEYKNPGQFVTPEQATVLGRYEHPHWGKYAAITENKFGKGAVTYIGSWPSEAIMKKLMKKVVSSADIAITENQFPVIIRKGVNEDDKTIQYIFNYSPEEQTIENQWGNSTDILTNKKYINRRQIVIKPWDLVILEEN
jgi:beta-galactosidase GanA